MPKYILIPKLYKILLQIENVLVNNSANFSNLGVLKNALVSTRAFEIDYKRIVFELDMYRDESKAFLQLDPTHKMADFMSKLKPAVDCIQGGLALEAIDELKKSKNGAEYKAIIDEEIKIIYAFIIALKEICQKISLLEQIKIGSVAQTFGRAMGSNEYRQTIKSKRLSCRDAPVPVFLASNKSFVNGLIQLSHTRLQERFAAIGARRAEHIVIFKTKVVPFLGPIPQKNGIIEYRLPNQIPIEIEYSN